MSEYISCAATAKLVRAALKKAFPGIKFSVRSSVYSGGASIRVGWMDGPKTKEVDAVVSAYRGGGFDGMIDMAFSKSSWLMPDGSASWASSEGTAGSMGTYEGYEYEAPAPGAKKVHFASNFIFCEREYSVATFTAAVEKVCAEYGAEVPEIKVWDDKSTPHVPHEIRVGGEYLSTMVYRELQEDRHVY